MVHLACPPGPQGSATRGTGRERRGDEQRDSLYACCRRQGKGERGRRSGSVRAPNLGALHVGSPCYVGGWASNGTCAMYLYIFTYFPRPQVKRRRVGPKGTIDWDRDPDTAGPLASCHVPGVHPSRGDWEGGEIFCNDWVTKIYVAYTTYACAHKYSKMRI